MSGLFKICPHPGCNKEVPTKNFKRHQLTHIEKERVKCTHDGCEKDFATQQSMENHKKKHYTQDVVCDICGKNENNTDDLAYHKRAYHTNKYICRFNGCYEKRASKTNIDCHMSKCIFRVKGLKENIHENDKKRKIEEVDENEEDEMKIFMDKMSNFFKDMEPKICEGISNGIHCSSSRISYGLPGKDKTHCDKHKGELVNLTTHCKFKECLTKGTLKIGGKKFCAKHRNELLGKGLPRI